MNEAPGAAQDVMSRHTALSELLRALFREDELRRLAASLQRDDELASSLPGLGSSRAELAAQLADSLARRNLVDAPLFARIARERPRQRERIAEVAAAWGAPLVATGEQDAGERAARSRRRLVLSLAAVLSAAGIVAVVAVSGRDRPCFADRGDTSELTLAREACAAYLETIRAFNSRDTERYHAGFREPMECLYDVADASVRTTRTTLRGSLDVGPESVSFLRVEGDARVVLCDLGVHDRGDGKGRKPHNKAIVMTRQQDGWKISVETTRAATTCYQSPC